MVIIGMISYPTENAKDVGKRFKDIPKLPSYLTRKGPYVSSELDIGIKTISIFECDPSKMAGAFEFIGNYYANFIGIPGFTYSVGTWFEIQEALKMIGLA